MIPTKHLSFSDFLCVNDTTITVTMEVLSLADDIENIGVEGYIGVGQIASTQKLPLTIHFF
jgi:outer membrane protein W